MSKVDNIFEDDNMEVSDFKFNNEVAAVFDDMVSRSVPFYNELQETFVNLVSSFVMPGTNVYDLGCSTGTTLSNVAINTNDPSITFIGLDNSQNMLDEAKKKLSSQGVLDRCELRIQDLNEPIEIENASVVYINWTLQFVRPLHRDVLVRSIYNGLLNGGVLILSEKVLASDSLLNRLYIKHYYHYKQKQGYSQTEIDKKREALENVLIPYQVNENVELLKRAGFATVDIFFRWLNWAAFLAIKR